MTDVINYESVELLYDENSSLRGSFAVDADLFITPAGQLCGGRPECPNQNAAVNLVKYISALRTVLTGT